MSFRVERSARNLFVAFLFKISANLFGQNTEEVSLLVDVVKIIPNIQTDIVYATNHNFTGVVLYESSRCYLRKEVAEQLVKVQQELNAIGLGLLVWDAYRPLTVQYKMWEVCPDERYIAPPSKGGRHTRGTAVDLTLIRFSDGEQLEMPTRFDDLTPRAACDYKDASLEAKKNRLLLRLIMEKYGFEQLPTEWWHFDYRGWRDYPVLYVGLHELS